MSFAASFTPVSSRPVTTRAASSAPRARVVAAAAPSTSGAADFDRRAALSLLTAGVASLGFPSDALAVNTKAVSAYLPEVADGFNLFVPGRQKTPAIRAGNVNPDAPYNFAIPGAFHEDQVANIQSGNYCQPRCVEPWTEVLFSDSKEGKLQVIVAPLQRLTPKKNLNIEEIGDPAGILTSVGAFITGTYLDEEDVVSMSAEKRDDGLTYYNYEIFADYGSVGPYTLTTLTAKGDLALMLIASANEKQWKQSESKLRFVMDSFRASVPRA